MALTWIIYFLREGSNGRVGFRTFAGSYQEAEQFAESKLKFYRAQQFDIFEEEPA